MQEYFTFYRDLENRWYIDLPNWEGDKEDLEMVAGADTMLDIIAQGRDRVRVKISLKPFEDCDFVLTFEKESNNGGDYLLTSEHFSFDVWLCFVTKFVFGELPQKIYIK
ncbi:MAG: hypothetical protein CMH22_05820 [Methylophaga sp.]|nr:hypothetical protein [Methylophaga sp.]|tara:strand:+ start:85212 stop:85538 length:327 start_codon:yes stop_codon:yes gene_type:complete